MGARATITPDQDVVVACLMGTAWVEVRFANGLVRTWGDDSADGSYLVVLANGAQVTAYGCFTRGAMRDGFFAGHPTEFTPDRLTGTVAIYAAGNLHLLSDNGERWPA